MGHWDKDEGCSGDVLWRIVALLFALAGLADAAASLPAHRRREVLGFLAVGEAEARAFVVGMATGEATAGAGPEVSNDAAGLAAHLRVLAFSLWFLLARARRSPLRSAAGRCDRKSATAAGPAGWTVPSHMALVAPDTS